MRECTSDELELVSYTLLTLILYLRLPSHIGVYSQNRVFLTDYAIYKPEFLAEVKNTYSILL